MQCSKHESSGLGRVWGLLLIRRAAGANDAHLVLLRLGNEGFVAPWLLRDVRAVPGAWGALACGSERPSAGYRLMASFHRPGDPPARVGCAAVSMLPAAGLFYARSRRAAPRARDPRARSFPIPASPHARGALRGGVSHPGVRSRATLPTS